MAEVYVKGLAELERKLAQLPQKIGVNATRRALRKGANVIRDQARANAKAIDDPQTREAITKNIATASGGRRREKAAGGIMMRVGVMGGARHTDAQSSAPGGNTTHWRWVEFGTSQVRARPFMRNAMNAKAGAAFDALAAAMDTEFEKELAKL